MPLNITLRDSPSAQQCRKLLGDLKLVKEGRKGRILYVYIYALVIMPTAFFVLMFSFGSRTMSILIGDTASFTLAFGSTLTSVVFILWLAIREFKLYGQNFSTPIIDQITPLLMPNEKPLTLLSAQIADINVPQWMTAENPVGCFIFTTDRLLILTWNTLLMRPSKLHHHIRNGTLERVIDNIYTVDLLNKESVQIGGFIKPMITFNISFTQIKTIPIGETAPLTWVLADKHIRAGKVFTAIRHRLENGYSRDF